MKPPCPDEQPDDKATKILELSLKNELTEIDRANESFNAYAEGNGIPKKVNRQINLVFDELLNNIISHAYRDDNEHDIELRVELTGDRLAVTIADDGMPFNPFGLETPDTGLSLEEREIGGLGIHLVRNVMDDVVYQRKIDKNVTTLIKHIDISNESQN